MTKNIDNFRTDQVNQIDDLLDRLRQNEGLQDNNIAPVAAPVETKPQNIREAPAHRNVVDVDKQYNDNLVHAMITPESFGRSQNGQHQIVVKSSEGADIQRNPYQPGQADQPSGVGGVSLRQPVQVGTDESLSNWQASELAYEKAIDFNENALRPAYLQPLTKNEDANASQATTSNAQTEYFDATATVTQTATPAEAELPEAAHISDVTSADFRFPSDLTRLQEYFDGAQVFSGDGQNYTDAERTQTLIKSV